jgi:hypothetical protein
VTHGGRERQGSGDGVSALVRLGPLAGDWLAVTAAMVFPAGACNSVRFDLWEPTMNYTTGDWGQQVLEPWLAANPPIMSGLRQVGQADMASVGLAVQDLWTLYALSRVAELLILAHQPPATDPDDPADWLPTAAYPQFVTGIGGTATQADRFHPFLHEIVEVEPAADPDERPSLVRQWWPGCMIGSLLVLRAGVTVRAGARHLDPAVTTGSRLYWAWWRRY